MDMSFNTNTINTEADSLKKGLYLQKLRAMYRLLVALEKGLCAVMCTIEYVDDTFELDNTGGRAISTAEQNKSYSKKFSLNSEEVLKSLRIFFDNWREHVRYSKEIKFVFYTNTSIAKENSTKKIRELSLDLPNEPILSLLQKGEYLNCLSVFKVLFKDYYIQQHLSNLTKEEKENNHIQNYKFTINSLTDVDWIKFLKLIEWEFEKPDENQLSDLCKNKIVQLCSKLNINKRNADTIFREIIAMLEEKSFSEDFLEKVVHVAEIELMFKKYVDIVEEKQLLDPMHQKWDNIDITDMRDLNSKILDVCKEYDDDIEDLMEEYIDGKYEQSQYYNKEAIKAYNYRIYKICKKMIKKKIREQYFDNCSTVEIDTLIKFLTDECYEMVEDKVKTYETIPFKDKDMVRKSILILIEQCYLAFDENRGAVNG